MSRAPEPPLADALADSIRALLRAFTIDERRFPAAERRLRYNGPDFQTIHFVGDCPGSSSAQLSAFLGVSPTTAQSVVERLIKRGLLTRTAHPTNKRVVSLSLTGEGEEVRAAIIAQDRRNCAAMLSALPAPEQKRLINHLAMIAAAVDERGTQR